MDATSGIRPQPGPQEAFLSTSADIAIYGGAAGGGKSFALLLEALRHINNPKFGAVIFRRQGVEIRKEGGLWDESEGLYHLACGLPRQMMLDWKFPTGARISFAHLEHEKDKYSWQGAQIALIEFDELTHFTKSQFFYMLSRNRSTSGIRPYIRASTNPDADSWVAELIAWWIDQETGYPIPERSGAIRYFIRRGEDLIWGDSKEQLQSEHPDATEAEIKSLTFISSSVYDNKILLEKDPGYLGNLKALPLVDRERLLGGNWKIRPAAGLYFNRSMFEIVDVAPANVRRVRAWDLAATEAEEGVDPDYTVGLAASRDAHGTFYIEHVERLQGSPERVDSSITNIAASDGVTVTIRLPQDPGQAGKSQAKYFTRKLAGYNVKTKPVTGSKVTRASPASAQAGAGNIKVVRGPWNDAFFTELENFPSEKSKDDQVDALSDAIDELLAPTATPSVRSL
jgi:predicted phage terminase large subunit-like protein